MIGYKLFTLRKDGSIGPLFINRRLRLELGKIYQAESHPTKGFALRPGWHICATKNAPHLSKKGRVWCKVWFENFKVIERPKNQGGKWYLAKEMVVLEICK